MDLYLFFHNNMILILYQMIISYGALESPIVYSFLTSRDILRYI